MIDVYEKIQIFVNSLNETSFVFGLCFGIFFSSIIPFCEFLDSVFERFE